MVTSEKYTPGFLSIFMAVIISIFSSSCANLSGKNIAEKNINGIMDIIHGREVSKILVSIKYPAYDGDKIDLCIVDKNDLRNIIENFKTLEKPKNTRDLGLGDVPIAEIKIFETDGTMFSLWVCSSCFCLDSKCSLDDILFSRSLLTAIFDILKKHGYSFQHQDVFIKRHDLLRSRNKTILAFPSEKSS